jgi:uncharacterized protein (DUF1800 family)
MNRFPLTFPGNLSVVPVFAAILYFASPVSTCAIVDLNENGYDDIWEQKYSATALAQNEDSDGDGDSNLKESVAGTDPLDALSRLRVSRLKVGPNPDAVSGNGGDTVHTVVMTVASQAGKAYQVESSSGLNQPGWQPITGQILADGASLSLTLSNAAPAGASETHFRVLVSDSDSDADGIPDWDELQVPRFDPHVPQSAAAGYDDLATLTSTLTAKTTALAANAYEKEGIDGRIRISRTGSMPLVVYFGFSGDPDPTKGSAAPTDYVVKQRGTTSIEPIPFLEGAVVANSEVSGTRTFSAVSTEFSEVALPYEITLNGAVRIPENIASVVILIDPMIDSSNEVPESLVIHLAPAPALTAGAGAGVFVRINDAQPVAGNEHLFIGYLGPEVGAVSYGSGISTVLLQGDNDMGLVNLSFSGLTTPQVAVHIHVVNPLSGPDLESLPLGQVSGHEWYIRAAQFLVTDQHVLDALYSGKLYVNVHSAQYPTGEIRGDYAFTEGSTELQIPPDPPPHEILTGEELDRDIVRFLTQSTFGPRQEDLDGMRALIEDPAIGDGTNRIAGMEAWIDLQMDPVQMPESILLEYTRASFNQDTNTSERHHRRWGWWEHAVNGRDQLRQRTAFALSQIFVTSTATATLAQRHYGMANYYDLITTNAFGTYRDLLGDVTYSPVMGFYLSHLKNQKETTNSVGKIIASPDENYTREIMQLLSFGLVHLHLDGTVKLGTNGLPIATYDNSVITEMAKVFTGLSYSKRADSSGNPIDNTNFFLGEGNLEYQVRWLYPMKIFQQHHEESDKTIFGGHYIPAGQTGDQDLSLVHDLLAAHETTAPFICRRLIQRFVTSNPSRGYLYRVAKTFQDTGGDFSEVVKAILLDYEARSLTLVDQVGQGKQKEPLIRFTHLMRFVNTASQIPLSSLSAHGYPATELAKFPTNATIFRMRNNLTTDFGQEAQSAPSVFNFFLPDFIQPGAIAAAGLVVPEFQITTESQVYGCIDYVYDLTLRGGGVPGLGLPPGFSNTDDHMFGDYLPLLQIYNDALALPGGTVETASEALVDYLDLVFHAGHLKAKFAGAPEPNPRSLIIESTINFGSVRRVLNTVYIVLNTPQYVIHK